MLNIRVKFQENWTFDFWEVTAAMLHVNELTNELTNRTNDITSCEDKAAFFLWRSVVSEIL